MPVFEWNANYELGVPIIDEQHKVLVNLINSLENILSTKSEALYCTIFADLIKYTKYHFTTEEALMLASGYEMEEINAHIKQHKQFIEELDIVCEDSSVIKESELQVILSFLTNWLTNHICKVDKKLASHIQNDPSFKGIVLHKEKKTAKNTIESEVDYKSLMHYFHQLLKEAEEDIKKLLFNGNKEKYLEKNNEFENALKKIALVRKAIGRLSLSR